MRRTSPHWKNDKFEKLKGNQDQTSRAAVLKKKKMMMMKRRRRRRKKKRMRRCFPLLRSKELQANIPQGIRSFKFVKLICKTYVTARG